MSFFIAPKRSNQYCRNVVLSIDRQWLTVPTDRRGAECRREKSQGKIACAQDCGIFSGAHGDAPAGHGGNPAAQGIHPVPRGTRSPGVAGKSPVTGLRPRAAGGRSTGSRDLPRATRDSFPVIWENPRPPEGFPRRAKKSSRAKEKPPRAVRDVIFRPCRQFY